MKSYLAMAMLLFAATGNSQAQSVYTRVHAAPKGVWVLCGKQIPNGFHYKIQRRDMGDYADVYNCYAPTSRDEIKARLFDVSRMGIGFDEVLSDEQLDFIWKQVRQGKSDSLFGYYANYPVLFAVGMAWYDGSAVRGNSYTYMVSQEGKAASGTPATLGPVRVPGAKTPATFKMMGGKATGKGISLDYLITNPKDLHHVIVLRSYYLRSGYEVIHPGTLFSKEQEKYYLNVLDNTATPKVPYSYVVIPCDAAGNTGDTTKPFSLYNVPKDAIQPSVDLIRTRSMEKEKAILLSWTLKNTRDVISIDIFKSRIHDGRYFKIASASPGDTAYMDYDVQPIVSYFYTIVLNGTFETSVNSPRISGMLKASYENLLPVNNFNVEQNGRVVKLSWNRVEKDTRAYYIYRANGLKGEFAIRGSEIESDSSFVTAYDTLPETQDDEVFVYSIRDVNTSYAVGPYCDPQLAYSSGVQSVPIPTGLLVRKENDTRAWILWKQMYTNTNSVIGYELYRRSINLVSGKSSELQKIATLGWQMNQYVDSTLKPGFSYFYSVKSTGGGGRVSSPSLEQGINVVNEKPPGVSSVKLMTADGQVETQWTNPQGVDIRHIRIERAVSGEKAVEVATVDAKSNTWTDTKVVAGKEYYYSFIVVLKNGMESNAEGPLGVRVK